MGARVLPNVQMLSEIAKQKRRGGVMKRETPRNKDGKDQEHDQGIRERSGWGSSRRVLVQLTESAGWWMGDDDSHGVKISIVGGVVEMVHVPTPRWPRAHLYRVLPPTLTLCDSYFASHELMTHSES